VAEGDNDFQTRLVPIENGFLVKRLGRVWFFQDIESAVMYINKLITDWSKETPRPFQGGNN